MKNPREAISPFVNGLGEGTLPATSGFSDMRRSITAFHAGGARVTPFLRGALPMVEFVERPP